MIVENQKFNRFTAIRFSHKNRIGNFWIFKCDCGSLRTIPRNIVISGKNKSCGCFRREQTINRSLIHGDAKRGKRERLHSIWDGMRRRCFSEKNNKFIDYGGRGIKVCNEWLIYSNFKKWSLENGYSKDLTIERVNNDGNYEPKNCKWIPFSSQGSNKRNSRIIEFKGERKNAMEWAKQYNIKYKTFHKRLQVGWSIEKALNLV